MLEKHYCEKKFKLGMKLAGESAGDISPPLLQRLICHFAVIILLGSVCHLPVGGSELDDLQQQELGEGAEPLLQEEAVSEEGEELIHPLGVHLLQLLAYAVELQHQAVHLGEEEELVEHIKGSFGAPLWRSPSVTEGSAQPVPSVLHFPEAIVLLPPSHCDRR